MAGDWIKMRTTLHDDPAVIKIADKTGLDEFAVVGRLHRFWAWADGQTSDGLIPEVTAARINRQVQQPNFAEAMVEAGWLKVTESGIEIPDFEAHNGKSAKRRAQEQKRKELERLRPQKVAKNADICPQKQVENADKCPQKTPVLRPREEKRRVNTPLPPKGDEGGEVASLIRKCEGPPLEFRRAASAISDAVTRVDLSHATRLVDVFLENWKRLKWGVGVLSDRLANARPDLPPDQGWGVELAQPRASPSVDLNVARKRLKPLNDADAAELITGLLGDNPDVMNLLRSEPPRAWREADILLHALAVALSRAEPPE